MTFILYIIIIIPHPRTACGSHRVSLLFSLLVSTFLDYFIGFRYFHNFIVKRMQMQSSHIRTVGLCFLACKAASFWSIFQKNSKKRVFWPLPYWSHPMVALCVHRHILLFCQSHPMVGCCVHVVHGGCLRSFLSEADWLSLWIFMTESRAGEGSILQCIYTEWHVYLKLF